MQDEIVMGMIYISMKRIFRGFDASVNTIGKELQPNLPFSLTLKPQKIHIESSNARGAIHQFRNKPSL
jgi:hypothetical protein